MASLFLTSLKSVKINKILILNVIQIKNSEQFCEYKNKAVSILFLEGKEKKNTVSALKYELFPVLTGNSCGLNCLPTPTE